MKRNIYFIAIILVLMSCQNSGDNNSKQQQVIKKSPPERIIPKDIPKMTISSRRTAQNIKIFRDSSLIQEQQKLLLQDDHIGNIKIVFGREVNRPEVSSLTLNKLNVAALDTRNNSYEIKQLQSEVGTNDSGDQYIKLDNGAYSFDLDLESGTYENFKIKDKGIGVVSLNGLTLRVGDEISGLEKYFPNQYESSNNITLKDGEVKSTRISLSEFIEQKSDVYLYVHHKNGIVVEIGTWEQY